MVLLLVLLTTLALAQRPRVAPDEVSWRDSVLESAQTAHAWFTRVTARGGEYAKELIKKLTPEKFLALMSKLGKISSGDESKSEAWMNAVTARLSSSNLPLSMYDKGQLDGILTSMGRDHAFLSLLLPNLFEVANLGDANNGNQEIKLAPRQAAQLARMLDTTPDQLTGYLPRNRVFPPGDWAAYNRYVDGVTGTVQRSGSIIPLFNGGYVPENGRPKVNLARLVELEGDMESRHLLPGYKLVVEDQDGCFPRAFRRIDQCQPGDVVYLTVYVFQSDLASWMMVRKLIDAKRRGCDVQVIYDAAGSGLTDLAEKTSRILGRKSIDHGATDPRIYQTLRNNGIPTIKYPIGKAKSQLNHCKLLLVGGGPNSREPATGFVFINVGTEYFALWDDFGWMIQGRPVADMMRAWVDQKKRVIERMPRGEMAQYVPRGAKFQNEDMASWISRVDAAPLPPNSLSTIRIVPHVGLHDQTIKVIGIAALKVAVNRVRIVCPYVTDLEFLEAVAQAGRRMGPGKVTLLVPANNDMYQTKGALWVWYERLVQHGVQVRESNKIMVHSKIKIFDNIVEGGSSNLDARSLWNNDEMVGIVEDKQIADLVESRVFRDNTDTIVTPAYIAKLQSRRVDWLRARAFRRLDRQL